MKTQAAILAFALTVSLAASAQMVYDQSFRDQSFLKFKVKLLEAILEKDTDKLSMLLADNVHVDDEACSYASKVCLLNEFKQSKTEADKLWDEMYRVASFGFSQNTMKDAIYRLAGKGEVIFQAPSYLRSFHDKGSQYLLVLGQNVNIREKPSTSSKVVAQASFEPLKYVDPMKTGLRSDFHFVNGKQWYEVELQGGRKGFILEDFVSASLDRELSVKKVNGEWKIISFYSPKPKC